MELEEQSKSATEKARATGEVKKQIVPPDLLEEVFELNMQLEELRMNKKMGEDDPALVKRSGRHKAQFEKKHEDADRGAERLLESVGRGGRRRQTTQERAQALDKHGRSAEPPQLHQESGYGT